MEYGYYQPYWINKDELEHFGIKGQKWGIRRYQNPDGTLTEAGKKRYAVLEEKLNRQDSKATARVEKFNRRFDKNKTRIEKADTASVFNLPYRTYAAITSASVARTGSRSQRDTVKAKRLATKITKKFNSDFAKESKIGKKYAEMTLSDITKSNAKINELNEYIDRYNRRYQYLNFWYS